MLAPSVERAPGPAHAFGIAARDRYPSYIEFLAERQDIFGRSTAAMQKDDSAGSLGK